MADHFTLSAHPAQKSAVVLDARLALEAIGHSFASSLAVGADVWLSREFVSLINPAPDDYCPPPVGGPNDTDGRLEQTAGEGLDVWRNFYAHGGAVAPFCVMGETPLESPGKAQTQPSLLASFDALIHTLNPSFDLGWSPFVTCGLQSLAIAASLSPDVPVIFTTSGKTGSPPALCLDAAAAGIMHRPLPKSSELRALALAQFAKPIHIATLTGASIAALWLVAPRTSFVASAFFPAEYVPERFRLTLAECLPWAGAQIFWTTFCDEAEHAE
jgi:hypothetical protein